MKFRAVRKSKDHDWYIQKQLSPNTVATFGTSSFNTKALAENYIRRLEPADEELVGEWIER
jgi:hypothetical protein